jgi:quercetin dioxygenase-like cupin family protein
MRLFEIQANGFTPYHKHDWEHEVFIKDGKGTVVSEGKEYQFKTGDAIFIPPDELHQFKNTSDQKLEFLCLIPNKGK